jgi:3-hydroxyisobutyrate dehydrogenase-like beta-hydroxyacid dehydrogenase
MQNNDSQAFSSILECYIQVIDLAMICSKVLIIGLGQLGLASAKYVKERGFDTYGYDINTEAMAAAHRNAGIKQVTDFGSHDFDIHNLCVNSQTQ